MDFRSIALNYLSEHHEFRPCPDQYLGEFSWIEMNQNIDVRQPANMRPHNGRCILLILESPHIKEFENEPGPAKGTTGTNIVRYLPEIISLESFCRYGLILINAVQYQCSLGTSTKTFRDEVFSDVWEKGGKTGFMSRLKALYKPGDIVINCCTKGNTRTSKVELRILVHRAIEQVLPGLEILRRNHPSSWHYSSNRKREWKLPHNAFD